MRHRKDAQKQLQLTGNSRNAALPFPRRIDLSVASSLGSPKTNNADQGEEVDEISPEPPSFRNMKRVGHKESTMFSITEADSVQMEGNDEQSPVQGPSNDIQNVSDAPDLQEGKEGSILLERDESESFQISSDEELHEQTFEVAKGVSYNSIGIRLMQFLKESGWLVGFSLKHGASHEMMDDLLRKNSTFYRSWKGVRGAILSHSGLVTSHHFRCSENHSALLVHEGKVNPCSHKECKGLPKAAPVATYEYIEVWPRLKARLQSSSHGPGMFAYYRRGLQGMSDSLHDSTKGPYVDFFSGSIFKDVASSLGGPDAINNDIFLFLTTDGVQPFKSSTYSYWPVILMIANLEPSQRFKRKNFLPIMVIPGPKNPVDLTSFLEPLLEELKLLGAGISVKLWDGSTRTVRVHLLLCMGDIPAITKLAKLLGHNAIFGCRFCLVEGIHLGGTYFPDKIMVDVGHDEQKKTVLKKRFDVRDLPMRTEAGTFQAFREIQGALSSRGKGAAEAIGKSYGLKGSASPLILLPTIIPYISFPIDLMHLVFYNIPRHWISVLLGEEGITERDYLSEKRVFQGVDDTLCKAGTGISSSSAIRRPRSLRLYKMWKAAEWKFFVLSTSLVALHDWIPENVLQGWSLFVRACEILVQWEVSEENVQRLESLCRKFYNHYSSHYYSYNPQYLKLCRYIYHLILHLADGIRSCGPLSMLAQWSMEDFVGVSNRRSHAKNKFGASMPHGS